MRVYLFINIIVTSSCKICIAILTFFFFPVCHKVIQDLQNVSFVRDINTLHPLTILLTGWKTSHVGISLIPRPSYLRSGDEATYSCYSGSSQRYSIWPFCCVVCTRTITPLCIWWVLSILLLTIGVRKDLFFTCKTRYLTQPLRGILRSRHVGGLRATTVGVSFSATVDWQPFPIKQMH